MRRQMRFLAMIAHHQFAALAQAPRDDLEDRALEVLRDGLREVRDLQPRFRLHGSRIRDDLSGEDLHQRRLAGSIAAQQADPLLLVDLQTDPLQQRGPAKGDTDLLQRYQCHRIEQSRIMSIPGFRQRPYPHHPTMPAAPTQFPPHTPSRACLCKFSGITTAWRRGGSLKRSLGMGERATGPAIPKSCGLEAATRDCPDILTHTSRAASWFARSRSGGIPIGFLSSKTIFSLDGKAHASTKAGVVRFAPAVCGFAARPYRTATSWLHRPVSRLAGLSRDSLVESTCRGPESGDLLLSTLRIGAHPV